MAQKSQPGASKRKAPSPAPVLVSAKPDGAVEFSNAQRRDAMIAEALRYAADPQAKGALAADSQPTGRTALPTLALHAIDDPTAFVELENAYRRIRDAAGTLIGLDIYLQSLVVDSYKPKAGAITNRRKHVHRGRTVTSFVAGSQRLFDFVHDNPLVELHPCDRTNDTRVILQNPRVVAINCVNKFEMIRPTIRRCSRLTFSWTITPSRMFWMMAFTRLLCVLMMFSRRWSAPVMLGDSSSNWLAWLMAPSGFRTSCAMLAVRRPSAINFRCWARLLSCVWSSRKTRMFDCGLDSRKVKLACTSRPFSTTLNGIALTS